MIGTAHEDIRENDPRHREDEPIQKRKRGFRELHLDEQTQETVHGRISRTRAGQDITQGLHRQCDEQHTQMGDLQLLQYADEHETHPCEMQYVHYEHQFDDVVRGDRRIAHEVSDGHGDPSVEGVQQISHHQKDESPPYVIGRTPSPAEHDRHTHAEHEGRCGGGTSQEKDRVVDRGPVISGREIELEDMDRYHEHDRKELHRIEFDDTSLTLGLRHGCPSDPGYIENVLFRILRTGSRAATDLRTGSIRI